MVSWVLTYTIQTHTNMYKATHGLQTSEDFSPTQQGVLAVC